MMCVIVCGLLHVLHGFGSYSLFAFFVGFVSLCFFVCVFCGVIWCFFAGLLFKFSVFVNV